MVSGLWCQLQAGLLVWAEAEEPGKSMLEKLDPATRGKLMMALFGLAVLGVGLILMIMMGGHLVRRLSRNRSRSKAEKPWYKEPLESDEEETGDEGDSDGDERDADAPRDDA